MDQRVAVRTAIDPLPPEETALYIEHRLQFAGGQGSMFRSDATRASGKSRKAFRAGLNQICDLSLLVGYADGLQELSAIEVEAAAEEIETVSWE